MSGIQRYLRENGHAAVSFYSTYDLLTKSLDAKMKTFYLTQSITGLDFWCAHLTLLKPHLHTEMYDDTWFSYLINLNAVPLLYLQYLHLMFKAVPHRTFILTTNSIIIIDHITLYHSYFSWLLTLFLDKNLHYEFSNGNLNLPHGSEQKTLCSTSNIKCFCFYY